MTTKDSTNQLKPYLSPFGTWAFALGTSIGWGSLVITSNTYLAKAGPIGSLFGLIIGALIMIVVGRNYHYMVNCYPGAGGVYAFSKEVFGYDHGFLTAWFMLLTYCAMLWANATSLPLFAKYFLGNFFEFGYLYSIFGYDVYAGELLLTIIGVAVISILCMYTKKAAARITIGMACLFCLGITVCFIAAATGCSQSIDPAYIPDENSFLQILQIACISPWAFIGFESVSHASEEYTFPRKKLFRILTLAVITSAVLYIFIVIMSASAYPPGYDSWLAYIRDHGNLSGTAAFPAFYAAKYYLGDFGFGLLIASLLCLIITSLIGNIMALSRLLYALAGDDIMPHKIGKLNKKSIPSNAILLVLVISAAISFIGRTAIGWVVDVTTIGAVLIYGYVSAASLKMARKRNDRIEKWTGIIGLAVMIIFGAYIFIPNLFNAGSMEAESYFLFVVWSVIGFLFFHAILRKDQKKRFGNSIVVWIVLLSLILFVSLVWMSRSTINSTTAAINHVQDYYVSIGAPADESGIILKELQAVQLANARSIIIVLVMFGLSLFVLLKNYSIISTRAKESEAELGLVKDRTNRDPLTGVKSKHAYAESEADMDAQIDSGQCEPFAVVVCDVNGLKYVNDTYGHKAGDAYICSASKIICELFQHSPVYRVGGDEFVVLLKGRDYEQRVSLMEELDRKVEANIASGEVVVSAGLSEFDADKDSSFHTVFERADARMYERKKQLKSMGAAAR